MIERLGDVLLSFKSVDASEIQWRVNKHSTSESWLVIDPRLKEDVAKE